MENFIISMGFKIAFTNTFNIPNTGVLFIDEGVSVLDKSHASNFSLIATFIKKYYNHIILITHIDTFYDYTFDVINIKKNKNKQSVVNYIGNSSAFLADNSDKAPLSACNNQTIHISAKYDVQLNKSKHPNKKQIIDIEV